MGIREKLTHSYRKRPFPFSAETCTIGYRKGGMDMMRSRKTDIRKRSREVALEYLNDGNEAALLRQIRAFFLTPFLLPMLATVPLGAIFGKVYEIWGFQNLGGGKAMGTAVLISAVAAGVYALYFFITYRIACGHVLCHGGEPLQS